MTHETHRRHLAGWIAAAAAATAVVGAAGVTATAATVSAFVSEVSNAAVAHAAERAGDIGNGGGLWSQGGDSSGSGSSSTGATGPTATAAQAKGVVLIDTVLSYQQAAAAGTGIVLTSSGEILTNNHVVEGSTSIKVTVASTGKSYSAKVVGTDATDDIAVLQLSGASGLTTASVGDSSNVSTGDNVTAVGNAGGTGTLTSASGTVTGTDKSITTQAEGSVASETLNGLIETNADIQAGDSGGPLYNGSGRIIGIDTAASADTTVSDGYAIPIDNALSIAHQIESGKASSTITIGLPAFLGVEVASDASTSLGDGSNGYGSNGYGSNGYGDLGGSDGAFGFGGNGYGNGSGAGTGTQTASGATISQVIDGTPAASAGLAAGDTITAVGNTAVTSADSLTSTLQKHHPGDSVSITWTDASGNSQTANVTLASGPAA